MTKKEITHKLSCVVCMYAEAYASGNKKALDYLVGAECSARQFGINIHVMNDIDIHKKNAPEFVVVVVDGQEITRYRKQANT